MTEIRGSQSLQLDFDSIEYQRNLDNFSDMKGEIAERSERLTKRVKHFATQFGLTEKCFWDSLEADPEGPLAAVLSKEARRQNIHENAAADYVKSLEAVSEFRKLPSVGRNACYVNRDGQMVTRDQLGNAPRPSKSIDFQWRTGRLTCYAAQKYTKEGGGNQDNQFNEVERLLEHFQRRTNNDTALFVLVDGPYYNEERLTRLKGLTRLQSPYSYVTSINELNSILEGLTQG